jgi:hypothetical protein
MGINDTETLFVQEAFSEVFADELWSYLWLPTFGREEARRLFTTINVPVRLPEIFEGAYYEEWLEGRYAVEQSIESKATCQRSKRRAANVLPVWKLSSRRIDHICESSSGLRCKLRRWRSLRKRSLKEKGGKHASAFRAVHSAQVGHDLEASKGL